MLYLEDTPTNIDFSNIVAVFIIFIDDVAIPNRILKPVLDRTMQAINNDVSNHLNILPSGSFSTILIDIIAVLSLSSPFDT